MSNELTKLKAEGIAIPKLTPKETRFLETYIRTGNGVQSAMAAYDVTDYHSAGSMASNLLKKLKPTLQEIAEAHNLTVVDMIKTLKDSYGAQKLDDLSGEKVADYPTRLKAAQIHSKLIGLDSKTETPPNLSRRIIAEEFFND